MRTERIRKHRSYRYIKLLRYDSMLLFLNSLQTLNSDFNYPVISLGSPARSSVKSRSITPDSTPNWTLSITFDLSRARQLPQFTLTFLVNHSSLGYFRVRKPSRSFNLKYRIECSEEFLYRENRAMSVWANARVVANHRTPGLTASLRHSNGRRRAEQFPFSNHPQGPTHSAGSFCLPFLDQ